MQTQLDKRFVVRCATVLVGVLAFGYIIGCEVSRSPASTAAASGLWVSTGSMLSFDSTASHDLLEQLEPSTPVPVMPPQEISSGLSSVNPAPAPSISKPHTSSTNPRPSSGSAARSSAPAQPASSSEPVRSYITISSDMASSDAVSSAWELLDLNTATLEQLKSIPGLSEKQAINIYDFRAKAGHFDNLDQVYNVPGCGIATVRLMYKYCYIGTIH